MLYLLVTGSLMTPTQFDEQVAAVRPVPFSEDAVVFELRDGRVSNKARLTVVCAGAAGG